MSRAYRVADNRSGFLEVFAKADYGEDAELYVDQRSLLAHLSKGEEVIFAKRVSAWNGDCSAYDIYHTKHGKGYINSNMLEKVSYKQ